MSLDVDAYDKSRKEWEEIIDQYVFNERDRKILKRRLLDGITYERLAEEFDLSTTHVKTICYRQMEKISKHI